VRGSGRRQEEGWGGKGGNQGVTREKEDEGETWKGRKGMQGGGKATLEGGVGGIVGGGIEGSDGGRRGGGLSGGGVRKEENRGDRAMVGE